jgi:hypothetical protein
MRRVVTDCIVLSLFRYGIHRQIVESSPVQLLFRPGGTERPRQRALVDEELAALLANLDEVTKRAKHTGIAIRAGRSWILRPRRRSGTFPPIEPRPALPSLCR